MVLGTNHAFVHVLLIFDEEQWWVAWLVWCLFFMMIVICKGSCNGTVHIAKRAVLVVFSEIFDKIPL